MDCHHLGQVQNTHTQKKHWSVEARFFFFFFQFCQSGWTAYYPSTRGMSQIWLPRVQTVKQICFQNPALFWRPIGIHSPNKAKCDFFFLKIWRLLHLSPPPPKAFVQYTLVFSLSPQYTNQPKKNTGLFQGFFFFFFSRFSQVHGLAIIYPQEE